MIIGWRYALYVERGFNDALLGLVIGCWDEGSHPDPAPVEVLEGFEGPVVALVSEQHAHPLNKLIEGDSIGIGVGLCEGT